MSKQREATSTEPMERMQLAERWRELGEKLRERSPSAFRKFVEMLATSNDDEDEEDTAKIDSVYPFH